MLNKIKETARLNKDYYLGIDKAELYEMNPGYLEITSKIYVMVNEFHELFQHPQGANASPELLRLRAKLIREKAVDEGLPAAKSGDIQNVLGAMADFLYVGIGTMVAIKNGFALSAMEYSTEQSYDRFMHSTYVPGNTVFDDMAIPFKEASIAADELESIADKLEKAGQYNRSLSISLRGALNRIYVACMMTYRLGHFMNVDIVELVAEIHRSNMSKLWPASDEERKQAVKTCKYDAADLAFRSAKNTDKMIGYRISDGKILKSPTYSDVNLQKFLKTFEKSPIAKEL